MEGDGNRMRRPSVSIRSRALVVAALVSACSGFGAADPLGGESILEVEIPGTAGGRTSSDGGTITKLFDVIGDWNQVSVDLAGVAQAEGWTITALNCVGTGNDVIAKKQVDGEWLLLESGAGERGAGLILRRDPAQSPPDRLSVTGRCPQALVAAAS